MKKIVNSIFALLLTSGIVSAQDQDPKAKVILDDLSKTTKAYKTITAEYTLTINNKEGKQIDKQKCKIWVKGNKFRLEIPGNIIVCDGKTVWTHNKDAGEVTIKDFKPSTEDGMDPTKIFTIYETGFKYKFEKDEKSGKETLSIINLYPSVKPEKKKFHTAKLYVNKAKKNIKKMKMLMKDGGTQEYFIDVFTPNVDLSDTFFVFDLKPFKADQIIDER